MNMTWWCGNARKRAEKEENLLRRVGVVYVSSTEVVKWYEKEGLCLV